MAKQAYEVISTQTLGSAVETVTFSSIPQTYTDLVVVINAFSSATSDLYLTFNGDAGTNYSRTVLWGTGASAGTVRSSSANFIALTYYGRIWNNQGTSVHTASIMNYSNTTTNKKVLARASSQQEGVEATVGLWSSTAAITSITFDLVSTRTFSVGSTLTLYGIKAA
jgi:hypothetical protein